MWFVIKVRKYSSLRPSFSVEGLHNTKNIAYAHATALEGSLAKEPNESFVVAFTNSLRAEDLVVASASPK